MGKYDLGTHEFNKENIPDLLKALLCEFVGTFIINFFACASVLQENPTFIPFAFGFAVFAANVGGLHISGGHVNPAVTISLLVCGRVPALRALCYVVVQLLGSIVGSSTLHLLCSCPTCPTQLSTNLSLGIGFCYEFFLGFLLLWVIFSISEATKDVKNFQASFVIGLTITLGHFAALKYTGSSMNPARSLGAAIASGVYKNLWIYMTGPIMGGIVAGLLHELSIGNGIKRIEEN